MSASTNPTGEATPVTVTQTSRVETGTYGRALLVLAAEGVREALGLLLDAVLDVRAHHIPGEPEDGARALLTAAGVGLWAGYSWKGLWLTATVTAPDGAQKRLGMAEAQMREVLAEHGWLLLGDAIRAWGGFVALADGGEPWPSAARIAAYVECLGLPMTSARRLARNAEAASGVTPEQRRERTASLTREILG